MFNNELMSKSQDTRRQISTIALASFRERGYEETTLRLIAQEAGTSVGNAYYYFPTKNHLVHELYQQVQAEHRERAVTALDTERSLENRLRVVLMLGLDVLSPYHATAPGFLSAAVSPASPVSPFGAEATRSREQAISLFRDAVDGAQTTLPPRLKKELPELLWMAYMGLALYWVYDSSPAQERSRRLANRGVTLFAKALPLLRLPLLRGIVDDLLDVVQEARA